MASRIASPPTTDPGAERGARPPTLWTQSAAKALANGTIESETAIKQYFRKLVFMSSPFERV
jgi:hypothetical protein